VGNVSTNVYAKLRCGPLCIKKALGIFRELIPTTRRIRTTGVAFWNPPSGSKNLNEDPKHLHYYQWQTRMQRGRQWQNGPTRSRLVIYTVYGKRVDIILCTTLTNSNVFSQFSAKIILRLHFTKILENFSHILAHHWHHQKRRFHCIWVNNVLYNFNKFKCYVVIFGKQHWKNNVQLLTH